MIDEERPRIEIWNGQLVEGTQALKALIDDFVTAIDQQRPPLSTLAGGRALAAPHKPVRISSVACVA
ncbi:MAG: hypothetical protein ACR2IK_23030 [Chloroflexota bacterium]